MSQGSKAGYLPQLRKIQLLLPYLTLNRPGFSKSTKVRGGGGGGGADSKRKMFFKNFSS